MVVPCTADSTDIMHSSTVFASGFVTRLNSASWHPSINHIYTQPFRKDNTNSITSILSKGSIPLLSSLSPWRASVSYTTFADFPPTIYSFFLTWTVILTPNSDGAQLTHLRMTTFWLSNTHRRWPNFDLNFFLPVFTKCWSYSSVEISSYIYTACNILFLTTICDQDKYGSLLAIYFLFYIQSHI